MSTPIESLELQIKSNSLDAKTGIDALVESLNNLKKATSGGLGLSACSKEMKKITNATQQVAKANKDTANSFINLEAKMRVVFNTIKKGAQLIGSAIQKSADYTENVNLFTVAMGSYAEEGRVYAEQVGEVMGIDPGEWMRNQGTFMTLATGFGVAGERANTMSKNLTQLGYDISSFFNLPYEDAMSKLQSGLAGELEPLRRIGYDLSVARLQQEAYTLGINKKVSAMTQAEKAELRYYAIMTQVTTAHGDMARTLDQPANQLRVLKSQIEQAGRAIGNIFIPALKVVLPYLIALVKVVRMVANEIARLFGYEEEALDPDTFSSITSGADDYSNALGGAADNAKKLKQYTMGFDELNVIDPNKGSNTSDTGVGGGSLGFELPTLDNFLGKDGENKVNTIVTELKNNISTVATIMAGIGAIIAGWAVSKVVTLAIALQKIAGLKFSWKFGLTGLGMFLSDLVTLKKYIDDFKDNGASFYNVAGIISTFAGLVGDALIVLGNVKLGGALKVLEGLGQIVGAIQDISKNGVDWNNAMSVITGLTNIGLGISVFTKNFKLTGALLAVQGLTIVIEEIATNWEAIKNGDWSGVDKAALVIGAIEMVGGIVTALGVFSQLKGVTQTTSAGETVAEVGTTVTQVNTSTTTLSPKLTSLAKNLGMGGIIIAEVVAVGAIFVGGIWLIGTLLDEVGKAWEPVIKNNKTVLKAIGIGAGILVAVGLAAVTLGKMCKPVIVDIGIGIAILAEISIATDLFLAEILVIGLLLQEILVAWQPVLDNGETIATGIGVGTGLLVAIGVVTAALGAVTVATAGTLPAAIAIGTAVLVELAVALVAFCKSLVKVANTMSRDLAPALKNLNKDLPGLKRDMKSFTSFMGDFALAVVDFTLSSAIAGIAATVDKVIDFFTTDPVERMYEEVEEQTEDFEKLIPALEKINPLIEKATEQVGYYKENMGSFESATGQGGGFLGSIVNGGKNVVNGMIGLFEGMANGVIKAVNFIVDAINKLSFTVPDWVPEIGGETFGFKLKKLDEISIPRLATGGMVDTGQMFIAREAGPEMVGTIGRRTAVVNNEQIVDGIASGVASANSESNALLREQNTLLRAMLEKESGVYLDGKSITKSVEKHQRERGRVLVTGGAY